MTMYTWSETAVDNDDADPTINAREGMAPSQVNNSMRGMMAAVAKYRNDTAGMLDTGGSGSAYTITSRQNYPSLIDGMKVAFRAHATNSAGPTLNVDGRGDKPLRMFTGASLPAGKVVLGSAYIAVYRSNTDEWLLMMASGFSEIPSGTKMLFAQASAPVGWTKDTAHNDKALRVVSGTPGSGGSTAFTSVFASRTPSGTVGGTTLTEAQIPSHRHWTLADASHNVQAIGGSQRAARHGNFGGSSSTYVMSGVDNEASVGLSSAAGGGGSHTHSFTGSAMDFAVAYVDVMIAIKD